MNSIFVIDTEKRPQPPVHPALARRLLSDGKAAIWRRYPFTLILKTVAEEPQREPALRVKIDPGSRTTGLAVVDDATGELVWAAELAHRGHHVKKLLDARRAIRRGRRSRKTRYRPARFNNRCRGGNCHGCGGNPARNKSLCRPCAAKPRSERNPQLAVKWLPPSLMTRVHNIDTWVRRLRSVAPVSAISVETVRFDTQKMENPEISGVEYQQGTLLGYEVREYLLEKWQRTCAYCKAKNVPLEIEHIVPRSRGGSNRITNLAMSCHDCNQTKGNKTAAEFGHPKVQAQAKMPLKDTAAVNATRYKIRDVLGVHGLPVEVGTGGRTKFNRTRRGLSKSHWADAACVGASTPECLKIRAGKPVLIRARNHGYPIGRRQMKKMDKHGFPRKEQAKSGKRFYGFQSGDIARAEIPDGRKNAGIHTGRITIRKTGRFLFTKSNGGKLDVHYRHLALVRRADNYEYPLPEQDHQYVPAALVGPLQQPRQFADAVQTVQPASRVNYQLNLF